MFRSLLRNASWFVVKVCVVYATLYIFFATYMTRMIDGRYDETGRFMQVPTMGRGWDLTPVLALAIAAMLLLFLKWEEECNEKDRES